MPRVYNKGKRVFYYGSAEADTLKPDQTKTLTKEQAATLKANFPNEIVNLDSSADMESHFTEKKNDAPAIDQPVMISVAQAEADKQAAIAEALAKFREIQAAEKAEADAKAEAEAAAAKAAMESEGGKAPQEGSTEALIAKIDAMDRASLVAFIENEGLPVEHKSKQINTLKKETLEALQAKAAA